MPTKREREYYRMGFADGKASMGDRPVYTPRGGGLPYEVSEGKPVVYAQEYEKLSRSFDTTQKRKRKLSAWNKFVKANSKKPRFRYRNGKLNLKKMAIAFRKTPAGKKKRR